MSSCSTNKQFTTPVEIRTVDTIFVTADKESPEIKTAFNQHANPSFTRTIDILHTDLDLKFDWEKRQVIGKAMLDFKPVFYATNVIRLDAKNMEIISAQILIGDMVVVPEIENTGSEIILTSKIEFASNDRPKLTIEYIAAPYKGESGGSSAITSDHGLYFINPMGAIEGKPTQIWTQGETESNSRWFPTVDKPNERCTQKITVTFPGHFKSLSNGLMTDSKMNPDGSRTDIWEMKKPHAPYLFMLAIGDFAIVKDEWDNKEVSYYVEPAYKGDARAIFKHTPEMLSFFSNILDYKYPWDKYSQVVVRDYVSGAMENTSATLMGQFIQMPKADLIDNGNDKIIAHELFHHWFGDLVTCESWANLTLNEGFANYSEYLWLEHKYGRAEADHHRMTELQAYIGQAKTNAHDLIDFNYDDKEDMFDAHSYNKGGLVLHMLRDQLGDRAFFAGLTNYLKRMEYKSAEVHDLRIAYEEVTGLDLNWFFNQWYLDLGHPVVKASYRADMDSEKVSVFIDQIQDKDWPLFEFPLELDIVNYEGQVKREKVMISNEKSTFEFDIKEGVEYIIVDPRRVLLAEIETVYEMPSEKLFDQAVSVETSLIAMKKLITNSNKLEIQSLVDKGLKHAHWSVRKTVFDNADIENSIAEKFALNDPNAQVRTAAVNNLSDEEVSLDFLANILENDKSNLVKAAALKILAKKDLTKSKAYISTYQNTRSPNIINALAHIYENETSQKADQFFATKSMNLCYDKLFSFYASWAKNIDKQSDVNQVMKSLDRWEGEAISEETTLFRRYAILTGVSQMGNLENLSADDKKEVHNRIKEIAQACMKRISF